MPRPKSLSLLLLLLTLAVVPSASAQSPTLPGRLPVHTIAYVYWRGVDSIAPGSRDPLVALWHDPGFAPARRLMEQGLAEAIASNPHLAHVPPGEVEALLAHPLIFGLRLVRKPGKKQAGTSTTARGFLVVRVSGKAAESARAALAGFGPKAAEHVRLTSGGFLVASGARSTLEDLVRRFGSSPPPESKSLASVPAYREARASLTGRPPVEFFLHVPSISSLQPRKAPGFDTPAFLHALNIERIHLLCGALDLNAPSAIMRFSMLGNTAPGGPFDLFGPNGRSFATLAAAPADTASFSAYRMDLGAVLSLVQNALSSAMNPQRASRLKMLTGMFSSAVLPALAGEYATISPRSAGQPSSVIVVTIHPKAADQLFTTTLSPFLQPAGQDGAIRYYKTMDRGALPGTAKKQGSATPGDGVSPRKRAQQPLFIALTPHFLLAGRDEALVKRSARDVISSSPAPGLAGQPQFRAARAELPAELFSLNYFDFSSVQWTRLLERAATRMAKDKKDPHAAERAAALRKWAQDGGGAVLARHLHWFAVGSWKDGTGVHSSGYIH